MYQLFNRIWLIIKTFLDHQYFRRVYIQFHVTSFEEASIIARKWTSVALILLALNAFSLNLGYGSPIFNRLFGFLSLIVSILLYGCVYSKNSNKKILVVGVILIFISFIIFFYSMKPEFWLTALPIFICGYDLFLRSTNNPEDHLPPLALGSLIYVIFYLFYIHIPKLWLGIRSLSQIVSEIIGQIVGVKLNIGPTMSGVPILLTLISCLIAFFILSRKETSRPWKIFLASLVVSILVYAGYLLALTSTWITVDMVMNNLYLLFLILLIPFILSVPKFEIKPVNPGTLMPAPRHGAALIIIFLSIVLVSIFPYTNIGSAGKVIFYEKDTEMGYDIPQFPKLKKSFEPDRGFSAGALKIYLENIGYNVEDLNDTDSPSLKDALKDANILVIINLKKPFLPSELQSIWDFVKQGGGLLIFGDHTSMFVGDQDFLAGRDYLSEVLRPTGIRINPDTADYINGHWKYGNTILPHYVTKDLGFDISTSSVGASLNLNGNARPVIIGKYAFSDKPDIYTPGHLGDRQYEKDEALGDLVIAASDVYGKGKVLVFGDTSYIFNVELPFRYKLFYNAIIWLRSDELDYADDLILISVIILIALILYIIFRRPQSRITASFLVSIAFVVFFSLLVSGSINESLIQTSHNVEKDIAWIDRTHLNQFNYENYQADSIAGLTTNLFRNDYLPMVMKDKIDFSEVLKGKVFIIIAPNEPYTPDEAALLRKFVDDGGLLIISAGYKNSGPLDSILNSFDMHIVDLPLGSPPWIIETHNKWGQGTVSPENLRKYWHKPKFMEAYPVWTQRDYKPISWINYSDSNYNLIIAKKSGQGSIVLIGDSRFLLNENLEYLSLGPGKETKEQYQLQWLGNIELLREILAKHKGEKA